jgi:hypothetical protein
MGMYRCSRSQNWERYYSYLFLHFLAVFNDVLIARTIERRTLTCLMNNEFNWMEEKSFVAWLEILVWHLSRHTEKTRKFSAELRPRSEPRNHRIQVRSDSTSATMLCIFTVSFSICFPSIHNRSDLLYRPTYFSPVTVAARSVMNCLHSLGR